MDKIVNLSMTTKNVPVRIDVVQYATKPNIVFALDDYTPHNDAVANLYIEKPDGTLIYNACKIEDNKVTYTPTTQSFAIVGTAKCQLQIIETDGTAVSFLIYADVTPNIIDSEAIESADEYTALEEAIQTIGNITGDIQTAQQTANGAVNRLDNLGNEKLAFTEATVDTTISDNLTLSTIFGRIKRLFTRTATLETSVDNLTKAQRPIQTKTITKTTNASGSLNLDLTSTVMIEGIDQGNSGNGIIWSLFNGVWWGRVISSTGTPFTPLANTSVTLTIYYRAV